MAKVEFNERTGMIIVKGVQVIPGHSDLKYKHFAGDESPTNDAGKQNFCVKITEEDAAELVAALAKYDKVINIKHDKYDTFFKVNLGRAVDIVKFNEDKTKATVLKSDDANEMRAVDHAMIGEAEISCLPYYSNKYRQWTVYLNAMWFIPIVDPVQAVIDAARSASETPMTVTEDDEVPFE